MLQTLYTSDVLSHFPYDVCETCYSPPIVVSLPRGSVAVNATGGVVFAMKFTDNQRNVQLKMPLDITLLWAA